MCSHFRISPISQTLRFQVFCNHFDVIYIKYFPRLNLYVFYRKEPQYYNVAALFGIQLHGQRYFAQYKCRIYLIIY